jgi:hypothetical protein
VERQAQVVRTFLREQLALKEGVVLETTVHSDNFTLTTDTRIGVELTLVKGFHCIYFQIAILNEL